MLIPTTMSEEDIENIWMRAASFCSKVLLPTLSSIKPSHFHVQKDAAMPLHPLDPAVLPIPSHNPPSHPPHEAPLIVHQQLLLPPFPKEKPCSWETGPTPALLQMMKPVAAPVVQPVHYC